jgi:hypothetical protein
MTSVSGPPDLVYREDTFGGLVLLGGFSLRVCFMHCRLLFKVALGGIKVLCLLSIPKACQNLFDFGDHKQHGIFFTEMCFCT